MTVFSIAEILKHILANKGAQAMKGLNLGTILAILEALGPVLAQGGAPLDEALKAFAVVEPILVQAGVIPPGIAALLGQIAAGYSNYTAGSPVTIGPVTVALLGAQDKVSLIVQKV